MFLKRDFTISTISILSGMDCTSLELLHEQWNPQFCLLCLQLCKKLLGHIAFDIVITINQQRELVAVTISGSVLFYSSAV